MALLLQGDARHLPLPDQSIQTVVTSPPYWGLRDYGLPPLVWDDPSGCEWRGSLGLEPTPNLYVKHLVEIFLEIRRVLRDDGTVWLNLGDSYAANRSYQVRDTLHKHVDVGNEMSMSVPSGLKPKDLIGIPWRVAFALQADGWWLRSDIIWSKPNPMPESVTDRPTKSHEYLFLLAKSATYYFDAEAIKEPNQNPDSVSRYARGRSDDHKWAHGPGGQTIAKSLDHMIGKTGRNRRTVWEIPTAPFPEAHFATFPPDLVKPCILAGVPPGGIVLDPFAGSGTVPMVAQDLGRVGIGVELKADYLAMALDRTRQRGLL